MTPDVLVAGGGIAGSALAIGLGRRGLSVEVFERRQFPREKPCGEGLMPLGAAALDRLGVVDGERVDLVGIRYHLGLRTAEGRFPQDQGGPATGRGMRRRDLDRALAERAAGTPGVALHTGVRVDGPLVEGGRVVGLVVEGEPRRAALVVAADGARSRLRHALGLDRPAGRPRVGVRAHFRPREERTGPGWVEVFIGRGHDLYITPLPRGEMVVAALAEQGLLRGPLDECLRRLWSEHPELARRLAGAERVSDPLAAAPLSGRARRRVLPGLALLGDAAGFTDPIAGQGMTHALVSAELLAEHASRRWGADDAWLEVFDREREAALRDPRRVTACLLWLVGRPALLPIVLGVLRRAPWLFSHLLGVSGGTRRLWGGAPRHPAGPRAGGTLRPTSGATT